MVKDSLGVLAAIVVVVLTNLTTGLCMRRRALTLESELASARATCLESERQRQREHAKLEATQDDLAKLDQLYQFQRKALKEKETLLALLQERSFVASGPFVPSPRMPAIDASVTAIKADVTPNLVLLSVGSDDKVEKGFQFSIYRGAEFVGKVVVEKVLASSCGCRVLFTKEGYTVMKGDSAGTRLQ